MIPTAPGSIHFLRTIGTRMWPMGSSMSSIGNIHPRPASVSILHVVKLPELGGDTLYASMYAANEALSEPFKPLVDGVRQTLPTRKPREWP